jgi:hypothetical protein
MAWFIKHWPLFLPISWTCCSNLETASEDKDVLSHRFSSGSAILSHGLAVPLSVSPTPHREREKEREGGRNRPTPAPQSNQSAGPVRFLIFFSIKVCSCWLAWWQVGDPSVLLVRCSRECTLSDLSIGISNLLQPAQAEVVLGQPSTYLFSRISPLRPIQLRSC